MYPCQRRIACDDRSRPSVDSYQSDIVTGSGVARVWYEERHKMKINNLRVTHRNIMKFMQ